MAGDRVRTTITLPAELDKRLRESVPQRKRSEFIAEAVVHDADGNEVGRGSGIFVRSRFPLKNARGYSV